MNTNSFEILAYRMSLNDDHLLFKKIEDGIFATPSYFDPLELEKNKCVHSESELIKGGAKIHSIKRLRDKETFTWRMDCNFGKIDGFTIRNNSVYAHIYRYEQKDSITIDLNLLSNKKPDELASRLSQKKDYQIPKQGFTIISNTVGYYGTPPVIVNGEGYMKIDDVLKILNNQK